MIRWGDSGAEITDSLVSVFAADLQCLLAPDG